MSIDIAANLHAIQQRIDQACARCGRNPQQVSLVAVSKKKPAALIEQAANAGQPLFGESYVQEFVDKHQQLSNDIRWHFIGALQSNKVKYLRGRTELIHSVDRLSLAKEISKQWGAIDQTAQILIQINVGDEATKAGATIDDAEALIRKIAALPHLHIRGLMALPPYADDLEQVRPWFRQLRQLAEHIDQLHLPQVSMDTLSMGMSHDFEIAIEEGATLIRVGTAIFGARE
ncbi:MAG: YggS family pyridoxal phosphate-dependent enzyme [Desulfuromonas sp.]|nr:YggS family pyridoxal phosphate-dependent enzyme [Desulfuromonas sp.]